MSFDIAKYIDHSLLKPTTTEAEITKLCAEVSAHSFAAVCVPPYYVPHAKRVLKSKVKIATVVGFPMGYGSSVAKVVEIHDSLRLGATEIDMVQNIAALKSGDWKKLEKEIAACIEPVRSAGAIIKLILETGLLHERELDDCCKLYSNFDIDFMKTSTGFNGDGATVEAVQFMRAHLPERMGIKASGGIRTFAFAKELVDAGATRIGTSAGVDIVKESKEA